MALCAAISKFICSECSSFIKNLISCTAVTDGASACHLSERHSLQRVFEPIKATRFELGEFGRKTFNISSTFKMATLIRTNLAQNLVKKPWFHPILNATNDSHVAPVIVSTSL